MGFETFPPASKESPVLKSFEEEVTWNTPWVAEVWEKLLNQVCECGHLRREHAYPYSTVSLWCFKCFTQCKQFKERAA